MTLRRNAARLAIVAAATLGACAGLRDSKPAPHYGAAEMPAAWTEAGAADAGALAREWWSSFGSAELASLVDAALVASPDMAMAAERVREAEAQVRVAGASLFPLLGFGIATGRRETRPPGESFSGENSSSAVLNASYEVDVWGRLAAGVRAADAALRASRFDRATVRLTLVAGVAGGYMQLLSLRGRITIARENLMVGERVLKLVDARARYGAVSQLDLARQRAAVLALRAALAPLELSERQTLIALAILAGRPPEGFDAIGTGVTALAVPRVGPGLPADLLTRRPDLASAEALLAAANANVAAARAALLPGFSLTGSAGLASATLVNFLNAPTAAVALGASLLGPIFDGGRLRGQVELTASRERELAESYRKTVLAALADVESALAAGGRAADQEALQSQVVEQGRIALALAEIRYREGVDDLLVVLDAQRTLFQAQDGLAQIRLARLQASIGLFKALGGGWGQALR